jgi:hypothetical protein
MSEELDSEFFSEAVADAKTIRETAIENAKDHLEEAFTPKLQSMLSQTIQQEMEGEEENGEDEEEIELDLSDLEDEEGGEEEAEGEAEMDVDDDGEEEEVEVDVEDEEEEEDGEEMEEITDQDELDLNSVMEFLEAASMDDRHSDPDSADDLSDDNVTYDDSMLDTNEFEDGHESDNQSAIMDDVNKIAQELEEETELKEELEDEMVEAFLDVLDEGSPQAHSASGFMDMDDMDMENMSMGEFMDMMDMDKEEMMDMMDMDSMEGDYEMEENDTVFEIDLNEFGVTGTDREAMDGMADVSGPYDTETDAGIEAEAGEGVDVGTGYDPEGPGLGVDEPSGTEDLDQSINTDNLYEEETYDLSALLEDDTTVEESALNEAEQLRHENNELKEELSKHRQAIKILREKINETNLINSKLLYTNRLFKKFGLNDRQKMKVIESFDRASNTREAKLIYTTLAENFNKQAGSAEQVNESRKSDKKEKLVEALESGLGSEKTGGSTTPSEEQKQILNENNELKSRFQKLADLK